MCGRFVQATNRYLMALLEQQQTDFQKSYNTAPGQNIAVIENKPDLLPGYNEETFCFSGTVLSLYKWGFKPFESKSAKKMPQPVNARKESIEEGKPFYKKAFTKNRILIPADGFYEWKQTGAGKVPHYFTSDNGMLFAGLASGSTNTCLIITTAANRQVAGIHNRMPVILNPDDAVSWLRPDTKTNELIALMKPFNEDLDIYPVSKRVNRPVENDPELLKAVNGEKDGT